MHPFHVWIPQEEFEAGMMSALPTSTCDITPALFSAATKTPDCYNGGDKLLQFCYPRRDAESKPMICWK
jgi:hypothetical protein